MTFDRQTRKGLNNIPVVSFLRVKRSHENIISSPSQSIFCPLFLFTQTQWAPTTTVATVVATTENYLDDISGKCVENCEVGTGFACGGIVPPSDTFVEMYDDARVCCQIHLLVLEVSRHSK